MKVILLQDVARIGKRHTEVVVPDGYALNQLIPKKLAMPATSHNRQQIARLTAQKVAHTTAESDQFEVAIDALKKGPITITAEANEQAHLFQAIHVSNIVAAAASAQVVIQPHWILIDTPIKSLGSHTVTMVCANRKQTFEIVVAAK